MTPILLVEFGSPMGLWVGAAALPIIVFFMLRRRLQERVIGSTMLWQKALEETPARASWRRPQEWLSLLLLLLAIAAAALAAGDFRFGFSGGDQGAVVVVIDVSASMSAVSDGKSRFEIARDGARKIVDALRSGRKVEMIAAGLRPRVLSHATEDGAALLAILDRLTIEPTKEDLRAAIDLAVREAAHVMTETKTAEIVVFSDFATPPETFRDLESEGIPVRFVACGGDEKNTGIVQIAGIGEGDDVSVVATIATNSKGEESRRVVLLKDGEAVDAQDIVVPADGRGAAVFRLRPDKSGPVRYAIALEPKDALAIDDVAYFGTSPRPPARAAIVSEPDSFLDRLPDVFPDVEWLRVAPADAATIAAAVDRPFDLVIVADPVTTPIPATRELWIGPCPDGSGWTPNGQLVHPPMLDWATGHPALRGVGFEDLQIVASTAFAIPEEGTTALVRVDGGAVFVTTTQKDREIYWWATAVRDSNWPLIPAFPLVIRNLLAGRLGAFSVDHQKTDVALRVPAGLDRLKGSIAFSAVSPAGKKETADLWFREDFFWPGAPEVGHFSFSAKSSAGDESVRREVGVSLASEPETLTLPSLPEATAIGKNVAVTDAAGFSASRPLWRWLIAIATIALLLEAWVWLRR